MAQVDALWIAVHSGSVTADYTTRRTARLAHVAAQEQRHTRLGNVRLLLALAAIALGVSMGGDAVPYLGAVLALFVVAVFVHSRIIGARDRARRAVDFYDAGLRRLTHQWMGHGDAGGRFQPDTHLHAHDLDVFGRGSLFELLGTCRTEVGQATLARWLLGAASPADIAARQAAIREMAPQLDLREQLHVEGAEVGTRLHPDALRAWAGAPAAFGGTWVVVLRSAALLAPVVTLGAFGWWWSGGPAGVFELAIAFQLVVALLLRPRVKPVIDTVDSPSRDLDLLVRTARIIEAYRGESALLLSIQSRLTGGDRPASAAIGRLSQLVALLSSRRNMYFAPVAGILLWATHFAFVIESWRRRHGHQVPDWLDAIGEFDALAALAGFAAEHPDYAFPDVTEGPDAHFAATALAHPLLGADAVANDARLGGTGPALVLISGSNMSGKSTYLRAVGLAAVMAQTGAPVRATTCRMSPLVIGASIRVTDSLQDGHSRFYAEILRLRHVVDLARASSGRTLFLLDEMLSGTNSHDRRHGAEGVLRGLVGLGAIGLATTHDLALGDIVETLGDRAEQRHFADVFDAGSLQFDYQLRPGPVRTSNALALMRSVGLEVNDR